MVLQDNGTSNAWIKVNGLEVAGPRDFRGNGEVVVPVNLTKENTIEVSPGGKPGTCLSVRVTQYHEQTDIEISSVVYFGLNTTSMEIQREFYDLLGFQWEIFPAGPEQSMTYAQSLGFVGNYWIHVALTTVQPFTPPFVDTVEFRVLNKTSGCEASVLGIMLQQALALTMALFSNQRKQMAIGHTSGQTRQYQAGKAQHQEETAHIGDCGEQWTGRNGRVDLHFLQHQGHRSADGNG